MMAFFLFLLYNVNMLKYKGLLFFRKNKLLEQRFVLVLIMIVAALFLPMMTNMKNVSAGTVTGYNAATCRNKSPTNGKGASITNTCNTLCADSGHNGPFGVFWINTTSTSKTKDSDPDQDVVVDAEIEEGTQKITAYLHGAFYTCRAEGVTGLTANHINFVEPAVAKDSDAEYYKGATSFSNDQKLSDDNAFIYVNDNNKTSFNRGSTNGSKYTWSGGTSMSTLKLQIDIQKFGAYVKSHGNYCDPETEYYRGFKKMYENRCIVGMYRCPGGSMGSSCWANNTEVRIVTINGLNNISGQVKVRDGSTSDWHDALLHNYDGDVVTGKVGSGDERRTDVSYSEGTVTSSDSHIAAPAGKKYGVYNAKTITSSDEKIKLHINYGLKLYGKMDTGASDPGFDYTLYAGTTPIASRVFKTTKTTGDNVEVMNLYIKYKGKVDGKDTFKFSYENNNVTTVIPDSDVKDGDTVCFTNEYSVTMDNSTSIPVEERIQYRTVCVKASADPPPGGEVKSKIQFEGAQTKSASTIKTTSTVAEGTKKSINVDKYIFTDDQKKVYGHFHYYTKADEKDTKYQYAVIGCDTSSMGDCETWIDGQETPSGGDEIKPLTDVKAENTSYKLVKKENDEPKYFWLQKNSNLTVCRKLFVKLKDSQTAEWDTSTACVHYSSGAPGELVGQSIVERIGTLATNCEDVGGIKKVTTTAGNPRDEGTVTVQCDLTNPSAAKTAQFQFTHKITGGGANTPKTEYRVYHAENGGSGTKVKSGNTTANSTTNITIRTGTNNGKYTLTANDGGMCESLWLKEGDGWLKTRVCALVTSIEINPTTCMGSAGFNSRDHSVSSGESWSDSFVSKNGEHNWVSGSTTLYAKPHDTIDFCHDYYPGTQAVRTQKNWNKIKEPTKSWASGTGILKSTTASTITAPTYTLKPSDTSQIYKSVSTSTQIEADFGSSSTTNTYSVTTSYPSYTGRYGLPGNGLMFGEINMQYGGQNYGSGNSNTGTSGDGDHSAIARSIPKVEIDVSAPGGYLKQSVSSYNGKLTRKLHPESWTWSYSYHYNKNCEKDEAGHIVLSTCTYATGTNGKGTGHHGYAYYEKDTDTVTWGESSYAQVYIPYNYQNTTTVAIDQDTRIYAGEAFRLEDSRVYINTRQNDTTNGDYATIAPDVTAKLFAFAATADLSGMGGVSDPASPVSDASFNGCSYYSNALSSQGYGIPNYDDLCTVLKSDTRTYNLDGNMDGTSDEGESVFNNIEFNAFDIPAGSYICVGLGVNPSITYDTSINTSSVYYSPVSCAIVWKKPSFAVWGGNVFSNGIIDTKKADKRVLANYYSYTPTSDSRRRMYSPWVEGIIVANNTVKNTASGAATGYSFAGDESTSYQPISDPGGIHSGLICDLSRLTIANSACASGNAGNVGLGNNTTLKNELMRRYIDPVLSKPGNGTGNIAIGGPSDVSTAEGLYHYLHLTNTGGIGIVNSKVEYGVTYVVAAEGNIWFYGDVETEKQFSSANQVPQLIIYTKGDINILPGVKEINAILIAEGKINTCANDDLSQCYDQLRINGSLIANKIEFNRTYGASVGSYSVVPAEIINYSPTLYLWSGAESRNLINESITETYTRELAPRQ